MSAWTRLARRLGAAVAAMALLLLLAVAWDLRPSPPALPPSFSQPLSGHAISALLDAAAWLVAVLLDLALFRKAIQFGMRIGPSDTELQLRRAFAHRERPTHARARDWREDAAPLAPPVLRLPVPSESELPPVSPDAQHHHLREGPMPGEAASDGRDELPGVLLLGPFELTGCKKKQARRQATMELIAYLAMARRQVSRDELLEALWPGDDPRRSAARLYQAVSEARKLLGDAFQRERDFYALDRERVQVDIDELDRLRNQLEDATGDELQAGLERALALFRGEPLAWSGALWAESEQQRLTALRTDLLEGAGRVRLENGDASGALQFAAAAAALDASNERPVQLAMEVEAILGRREAVVERYERLRRELAERFGLEPSRDTRALYRRLLSQDAKHTTSPTV
jgi:DNA-binding SARP family transcriptional activator